MKIGIDARFLTHPQKGGYKTYTENLVSALACVDQANQYILYVDRLPDEHAKIPKQPNFSYEIIRQMPVIGMPLREQVGLSLQIARDRIDLLHSPCLTAPILADCPLVVTIHDMIWLFPHKYSQYNHLSLQWTLMEWYNLLIPRYTSRRAAAIITVSQFSKKNIVEYLGIDPSLIFVTHEAVNSSFGPNLDQERAQSSGKKYGLQTKFIMAIGSADPRKNIETLVKAYSLLPQNLRAEYHLVIVWTASSLSQTVSEQVQALGIGECIHFLTQVTNEDLFFLYHETSLFVFPSLYEGFGLPMLEAMACGVPVVAANTSSIPEIAGDAARLFEPKDAQEMSATIARVLSDENLKSDMVKKGFERNAMFSWEKCARETLAIYTKVLSKE